MKRMLFQAGEDLLERARRRARERGVSVSQIVREALERELGDGAPPALTCIGAGEGTGESLAERVEELWEPDPWRS
ncbi:MAG: ribbon-helix-helix protein, CopG family [Solirubrobacterales bacterium]|nr:ribbon-helix-helix protein, CopG family [Solirubrobacterales bacterium]